MSNYRTAKSILEVLLSCGNKEHLFRQMNYKQAGAEGETSEL